MRASTVTVNKAYSALAMDLDKKRYYFLKKIQLAPAFVPHGDSYQKIVSFSDNVMQRRYKNVAKKKNLFIRIIKKFFFPSIITNWNHFLEQRVDKIISYKPWSGKMPIEKFRDENIAFYSKTEHETMIMKPLQ